MNKVTVEQIKSKIINETFTILPSGKVMVCELTLENGYTVRGEAAVVDKKSFDEEIGKKFSRERAESEIWQLEGYLLQEKLFREGVL